MEALNINDRLKTAIAVCTLFIPLTIIISSTAFGHGGKTHGGQELFALDLVRRVSSGWFTPAQTDMLTFPYMEVWLEQEW